MKYKKLNNVNTNTQYISDWIQKNLEGNVSEFTIYNEHKISCSKISTIAPFFEFPFRFVDVELIRIQHTESLKNFHNFPESSKPDLTLLFTTASNTVIDINWNNLPYYDEVDELHFEFGYIDNITIADLSKYNNLSRVTMYRCDSNDLYDLSKYNIKANEYVIYPRQRIKNLSEIILNDNINIILFRIACRGLIYSFEESIFINEKIMFYNTHHKKNKKEYVMDFTLELIDNGFGDDV